MRIQNLAVIFIIIVIPIILVLSYYMSLQRDTINMQASYNTKLLESTKEAIEAFEINTVEWNEAYSETADSKRRDVMAAINTFVTSFANNIGIGGASKEDVLTYIPAIAFIGYDGYYIYAPEEVPQTVKDKNGVTVLYTEKLAKETDPNSPKITGGYVSDNNDKILYIPENGEAVDGVYKYIKDGTEVSQNYTLDSTKAKKSYEHILKQYIPYSARYVKGNIDIVVNYTLDNYITITGMVNGEYVRKSGYLVSIYPVSMGSKPYIEDYPVKRMLLEACYNSFDRDEKKIYNEIDNLFGIDRRLEECVNYLYDSNGDGIEENILKEHYYVYDTENIKTYFDDSERIFFQISSKGKRINLNDLETVKYKKTYNSIKMPKHMYYPEAFYMALNKIGEVNQGEWFTYNKTTESFEKYTGYKVPYDTASYNNQYLDATGANYYVEAIQFSNWIYENIREIETTDIENIEIEITGKPFNSSVFAYDENNPENKNELFSQHKMEVIKQTIISGLNQAITSYGRNSSEEFRLPNLTETDWEQALSNISMIAFVQGIPIGLKQYNNYAIATSTMNKEYVDSDGIYLTGTSQQFYHLPACNKFNGETTTLDYLAYRNIDYVKRKKIDNSGFYYLHNINQACYYCIIQRSLYERKTLQGMLYNTENQKQASAYFLALGRERYVSHEFIDYEYSP